MAENNDSNEKPLRFESLGVHAGQVDMILSQVLWIATADAIFQTPSFWERGQKCPNLRFDSIQDLPSQHHGDIFLTFFG
jgi:hypothetical protein